MAAFVACGQPADTPSSRFEKPLPLAPPRLQASELLLIEVHFVGPLICSGSQNFPLCSYSLKHPVQLSQLRHESVHTHTMV